MSKPAATMIAVLLAILAVGPAFAQDPSEAGRTLPAICTSGAPATTGADSSMTMGSGSSMSMGSQPMDKAHQDLMKGMGQMDANMNKGMAAKNLDVAFICGMIPHHQGAIDMAKAELAHGKDPFARRLAQDIVTAQEKEIAEMLAWLAKQPH